MKIQNFIVGGSRCIYLAILPNLEKMISRSSSVVTWFSLHTNNTLSGGATSSSGISPICTYKQHIIWGRYILVRDISNLYIQTTHYLGALHPRQGYLQSVHINNTLSGGATSSSGISSICTYKQHIIWGRYILIRDISNLYIQTTHYLGRYILVRDIFNLYI